MYISDTSLILLKVIATKVVEEIKTHVLGSKTFFPEYPAVYVLM
jgi:hypothetical protein